MTLYAIFEPEFGKTGLAPVAVPEKFSWLAAILPPVFFVRHGLWFELIVFVALVIGLYLAAEYAGGAAIFWLYVLLVAWLGSAASSIRRAGLRRGGWRYRAEIVAPADDTARLVWLKLGGAR
jgi:hypothetical protein